MILGPRGPFVVKKGPDDWWDVIDVSRTDENRLALAYQDKDARNYGAKNAKAAATAAAKFMNEFTQEEHQ